MNSFLDTIVRIKLITCIQNNCCMVKRGHLKWLEDDMQTDQYNGRQWCHTWPSACNMNKTMYEYVAVIPELLNGILMTNHLSHWSTNQWKNSFVISDNLSSPGCIGFGDSKSVQVIKSLFYFCAITKHLCSINYNRHTKKN